MQIMKQAAIDALGPGNHCLGDCLWVAAGASSRSYFVRATFNGRKTDRGLGSTARVTPAMARKAADELLASFKAGIDPAAEKKAAQEAAAKRKTFADVAAMVLDMKRWRANADDGRKTSLDRWNRDVAKCSAIADKDVADISLEDVKGIVLPLEKETPIAARQVLNLIAMVLGYAIGNELREKVNYAAPDAAQHWMPRRPKKEAHAALDWSKAPAFLEAVRSADADSSAILEFAILTAARSGEARGARWSEINFDHRTWTVAGERMKKDRAHVVPLSDAAVALLRRQEASRIGKYIFPGFEHHSRTVRADRPMPNQTVWNLTQRLGEKFDADITTHGFRATFKTWCGDHGQVRELAERSLAHLIGDEAEQAYDRTTLIGRRRPLMQAWADFLDGAKADNVVVPLKAVA